MTLDQKLKACATGGTVNSMYRLSGNTPAYDVKDPNPNAGNPDQAWQLSGFNTQSGSQTIKKDSSNAFDRGLENAKVYQDCTLAISGYTPPLYKNGECQTNWVGPGPSPDPNATPITTPGVQITPTPSPPNTITGGWNCNTAVGAQFVPGLNIDAAKIYVDNWYKTSCSSNTQNAWTQCVNDVIARSLKACVDPLFTLAIWIHESTASNYVCGEQRTGGIKVEDFGIHSSAYPPENFSAQINEFLQLPSAYARICPSTVNDFFSMFGESTGVPQCFNQRSDQSVVTAYASYLQSIYSALGGGTMKYPIISGCTPTFTQ